MQAARELRKVSVFFFPNSAAKARGEEKENPCACRINECDIKRGIARPGGFLQTPSSGTHVISFKVLHVECIWSGDIRLVRLVVEPRLDCFIKHFKTLLDLRMW
jgi:hypothetical protein